MTLSNITFLQKKKNHSDVKNAILSTSTWLSYLTNALVQHIKPENTSAEKVLLDVAPVYYCRVFILQFKKERKPPRIEQALILPSFSLILPSK